MRLTRRAATPCSQHLSELRKRASELHRANVSGDLEALSSIYADDYMLVRPDGSSLSKHEVLHDLRDGGLMFKSVELDDVKRRSRSIRSSALLTWAWASTGWRSRTSARSPPLTLFPRREQRLKLRYGLTARSEAHAALGTLAAQFDFGWDAPNVASMPRWRVRPVIRSRGPLRQLPRRRRAASPAAV